MQQKIQTFINTCLRRIYNIRWPEKVIKRGPLGESGAGAGGQADTAEKVGLDWTYPQEASTQHHTPSPNVEPTGKKEERQASQQLEARH